GRRTARPEPVADRENDIASRLLAPEQAVAIAEAALAVREGHDAPGGGVQGAHEDHGLADLLTIGPDVLHRRRADQARDAAQALEAGPAALDAQSHQIVPGLAGGRAQLAAPVRLAALGPAQTGLHPAPLAPVGRS